MDIRPLDQLSDTELRSYLEFLLWHYRVADSFWFIYASEKFGQAEAEALNEKVWSRAGAMAAKDLRQRFGIREKGLEGFVQALQFYPWAILIGYQIATETDCVRITVPHCPTQEAHKKRGLSEYSCKEMHRREFEAFAQVIDPRIQVTCMFAPPDPHPATCYCEWLFRL